MHDPFHAEVLQGAQYIRCDSLDGHFGQPPLLLGGFLDALEKLAAVVIVHDHVDVQHVLVNCVRLNYVRMIQLTQYVDLAAQLVDVALDLLQFDLVYGLDCKFLRWV